MLIEHVIKNGHLSDVELSEFVAGAFSTTDLDGKKVLCIIPDATRSMPMPTMFRAICKAARGRVSKLEFIIALATHPAMSDEAICRLVGITPDRISHLTTFDDPVGVDIMTASTNAEAVPREPFGGLLDSESMLFEVDGGVEEHMSSADLGTVRQTRRSLKSLLGRVKKLKETART